MFPEFGNRMVCGTVFALSLHPAPCRQSLAALKVHNVFTAQSMDGSAELLFRNVFEHEPLQARQPAYWEIDRALQNRNAPPVPANIPLNAVPGIDWHLRPQIHQAASLAQVLGLHPNLFAVLEESTVMISAVARGENPADIRDEVVATLVQCLRTFFDRPMEGRCEFLLQLHAELLGRRSTTNDVASLEKGNVPNWLNGTLAAIDGPNEIGFIRALFDPKLSRPQDERIQQVPRPLTYEERLALLLLARGHLTAGRISRLLAPRAGWTRSAETVAVHLYECLDRVLRSDFMS